MDVSRHAMLVESTVDYAIFHLTLNGLIESWNPGAERLFGYSAKEIVGQHASVLFVPEDVFRGEPEREARFATETGRAADIRWHLRKDGTRFWADGIMLGLRDAEGVIHGLAKIIRDESQQKQADEMLNYQLSLSDAIASHAAEALLLVDREGRTTFVNRSAEQMFGWSTEELMGQFLHDKLHSRHADGTAYPISEGTDYRGNAPCPAGLLHPQGRPPGAGHLFHGADQGRQLHRWCGPGGAGRNGSETCRGG
jgi:PAS domain S-box-containing protein